MNRYQVQERFAPLGPEGQKRLAGSRAVIIGVGGLGGLAADLLARAGVGRLRLIDPDRVSLDNLHRQLLFDEEDAAWARPKVRAAARRLGAVNSGIEIQATQETFSADNGRALLTGADVVLDCLDRPEPRFVLNRICLELNIPWVHGGVTAAQGQVLVIRPGIGPCFRCWFHEDLAPARITAEHGVIGPAPAVIAGLQASEALKLLLGREEALLRGLLSIRLWPPRFTEIEYHSSGPCPDCGRPPGR